MGYDREGNPVTLQEIWPNQAEVNQAVSSSVTREMFQTRYQDVFAGDQRWREVEAPDSSRFSWDERSTYIRRPTYFDGMTAEPEGISEITGARVLARLGDSITTDHISPAGAFKPESPAGKYLREKGVG